MEKILIVDDNDTLVSSFEIIFRAHGFETLYASNGFDAMVLARLNRPILIISDIQMPKMDGFTLCRECQKDPLLRLIPFVFYSAIFSEIKSRELAHSLGVDQFISKSTDPDEFIGIIAEVLEDFKSGKLQKSEYREKDELEFYKSYSEALASNLEDKIVLAEINKKLQKEIEERRNAVQELNLLKELCAAKTKELEDIKQELKALKKNAVKAP
ncbi:MAG: response regulator [Candidatus Kapabacteria bacterium]|nr:response regulator [Candidatus Kapabacteria bacterium]